LAQSTAQFHLALHHFTAVCDILGSDAPGRALVDGLACRSGTLRNLARLDEADKGARLALELAEQLGYAEGEAFALTQLSLAAGYAGDHGRAMGYAVQAGRVDRSALPDRLSRRVALVLTIAYINAGDLEPAWQTCVEGLRLARVAGDIHGQADFLQSATSVALQKGAYADAGAHIRESLRLTDVSGDRLRLLGCLHDCAQLCAATGRFADAVTLRGAEEAQAAALDLPIPSSGWSSWSAGAASSTRHLGARRVGEARRRGAAMSLQTATEFASMLAAGAGSDSSDGTPDAVLTPRERAVIALVARGRTDAQIAAELFISIRTVRSHLDRIRDKTGSRRRPDLTRFALREGLA
jgi:DNA-binding CsgD family transcriptional regulator/tetratricopeptide (TPR) repeat protein